MLTLITIFTTYLDHLPDLQFLHDEIKLTYNTLKERE